MTEQLREDHGALVGWSAQNLGNKLVLRIQSISQAPASEKGEVHSFLYVLDRNQAVQLGNYLFEITGQTAPRRKRNWLDRLLGT